MDSATSMIASRSCIDPPDSDNCPMPTTSKSRQATTRFRYHHNAYRFLFSALRHVQDERQDGLGIQYIEDSDDAHVTGQELLEGVRELALQEFGCLATTVFRRWGVTCTEDFGKMVFEMVERGEMRKTEQDCIEDFIDGFDFGTALDQGYRIDASRAFKR